MFGEPMREEEINEIRNAGRRGLALGDEASCRALEARIGQRITPRRPGRHRKKDGAGEGQAEMVV
jgi:hypothetical protein